MEPSLKEAYFKKLMYVDKTHALDVIVEKYNLFEFTEQFEKATNELAEYGHDMTALELFNSI